MRRLTLFASCVGLVLACAHHRAPPQKPAPAQTTKTPASDGGTGTPKGEAVLAHAPEVAKLKPFNAPIPTVVTLANGMNLYLVQREGEPVEAVELVLRAGATSDPAKLPGLASMSAAMLQTGAAGKSQLEIAREVDAIGARLTARAGEDATWVAITGLSTQAEPMVKLLAEVALRPNLSEVEWKKLKQRREAELLARRASPVVAARRAWSQAVYGDHPLAHPVDGTVDSIRAMRLQDVQRFIRGLSPTDAAIVVVGGAVPEQMTKLLTDAFGDWKPSTHTSPVVSAKKVRAAPPKGPRFVAVNFPGKVQSVLRVGQPGVPRDSPDYLALSVMNEVLGGSFTSRLMQNLREKHGYTYGAGSFFAFGEGPGPFIAQSSVKTAVTTDALQQMMDELDSAAAQPISSAELKKGKALLTFDLVRELQFAGAAADELASIFLYDLPLDEYETFVPRLNQLTESRVQAATSDVLHPDRMTIAVAGDMAKVLPSLERDPKLKLGAPQWRAPSGALLPQEQIPHFSAPPPPTEAPDAGTAAPDAGS